MLSSMPQGLHNILICGKGLALELTLAALSRKLPESVRITSIELTECHIIDSFYGHVTSPDTVSFNRTLGIEESEFLLGTNSSFSYGTQYTNWAKKNWVQCHHLPFPVWENVPFLHYLTRSKDTLEPYLVNAECGKSQAFAHPPPDKNVPLSRAEYAYQISPDILAAFYASLPSNKNLKRIKGEFRSINFTGDHIQSLTLQDGQTFEADLFIDASGQSGVIMNALNNRFESSYSLHGLEAIEPRKTALNSLRQLHGTDQGWQSHTTLRDTQITLCVSETKIDSTPISTQSSHKAFEAKIGHRIKGWESNCVAIGHIGYVIDPLTPAPIMLLQRDVLRLLSLIPVSQNMKVEAREFNRLRQDDLDHVECFHRAFFETTKVPETPYWNNVRKKSLPTKLKRKIDQFESRGFLTNYDLDPFNEQDWAIQHFGIGRRAQRYDIFIDKLSDGVVQQNLAHMRQTIKNMAVKVPPQERYLSKFIQYLEKKNYAAQHG